MIKWLKRFLCRRDNWHNEGVRVGFNEDSTPFYVVTGKCDRCGEQRPEGVWLGYKAQAQIPGHCTPLGWPFKGEASR
jgi:hypothetical protein